MWSFVQTLKCISRNLSLKPQHRHYLSSAYKCQDAWNQRLQSPYFKKINETDMFFDLENQFQQFGKAHSIDIDLFANIVTDIERSDEVEDLLHKLRLSPEACNLLPSTQHAFIRFLIEGNKTDDLLRVLDDRLNYGVFMDDYTCIYALDKFLEEGNFKDAARVASLQMLQEDFSHPMVRDMSLYACLNYCLNPTPWYEETKPEPEENDVDDEDEEIKLRVPYLRNYYFDDHFDLRNPSHLVGKTLWMIGCDIPNEIGNTCQIIGLGFYKKWDKLKHLLQTLIEFKQFAYKNCINILDATIREAQKDTEDNDLGNIQEVEKLLQKMNSQNLIKEDDMLQIVKSQMLQSIGEHEQITVQNQVKIYTEWEKQREILVKEQIEMLKRDKIAAEIDRTKKEMKETEDELFFFENEDKLDLLIETKYRPRIITWKGRIKKKRETNVEYVPPEIEKRREN